MKQVITLISGYAFFVILSCSKSHIINAGDLVGSYKLVDNKSVTETFIVYPGCLPKDTLHLYGDFTFRSDTGDTAVCNTTVPFAEQGNWNYLAPAQLSLNGDVYGISIELGSRTIYLKRKQNDTLTMLTYKAYE